MVAALAMGGLLPDSVIAAATLIDQSETAASSPEVDSRADSQGDSGADSRTNLQGESSRSGLIQWGVIAVGVATVTVFFWRRGQRLHHAPRQPRAFEVEVGLALVLVMYLFGMVGAGVAQRMAGIVGPEDGTTPILEISQITQTTLGVYAGQSIVLLAYWWFRRRAAAPRPESRWPRLLAASLAVAITPLVLAVVFSVGAIAAWLMRAPDEVIAHDTLRQIVDSPWEGWTLLLAALVTLATPLFEELMYRGLLQRAAINSGLPRWPAIIGVSVCFALMHGGIASPHALPALFTLSLILGWVYERSGRLTAPVALHALFNAANLVLAKIAVG